MADMQEDGLSANEQAHEVGADRQEDGENATDEQAHELGPDRQEVKVLEL